MNATETSIERACRWSPFLAFAYEREGELVAQLDDFISDPLGVAFAGLAEESVARRLRVARRRVALGAAVADLSGRLGFVDTTRLLSDFADHALHLAIETAIRERVPDAPAVGFVALALGKLGGRELNYSSDIDPIFLYDPATLPHRERESVEEAAVRIGRRVVELLQARDADGYVLRVDLRLRPTPEATPIAIPVAAATTYYEGQALAWERAAFIRARPAAGDVALGQRFLDAIQPFVWRRALDYGAVQEIRGISRRIRAHHSQGQRFGPGYDLKRGRGGIREVEFFAQIHQLIHGGRDRSLRPRATLDALEALAQAGRIAPEDAATLSAAYVALRTAEHRVQMIDDRQTHALPARAEALDQVARLHGLEDGQGLLDWLAPHVTPVATLYDSLDDDRDSTMLPSDPAVLEARLAEAGFSEPAAALRLIEGWRGGNYPALRSPAAREALEASLPAMIGALGQGADPGRALVRLDAILRHLSSAINFFRLLEAQPPLARLLGAILSHAPALAEALGARAELLDGLIDTSALEPVGTLEALVAQMRAPLAHRGYERLLDHVRAVVNEKRFALGVQIVAGTSDPLEVSRGYSRVAEAAIEVLAAATVAEFEATHGRVPGSELAILALGRLGGGALTWASDLDLVFVFTGDYAAESDGPKPLGAVIYFNRLAQRIVAAMSVPTAAGPLYEIDTRLRPSGAQGPLTVSLDAFARYQRESAWTWEHMALTRARPVFGSDAARAALNAEIGAVLAGARPARDIAADAAHMRAEMAGHKPPMGPLDAKLLDGGLIDLEFAVHVTQLTHRAGFDPDLGEAIELLVAAGLLPPEMREAYQFLSRLLVAMRLVAPDGNPPAPATQALIAHAVGADGWDDMVARFDHNRQLVREQWARARGA